MVHGTNLGRKTQMKRKIRWGRVMIIIVLPLFLISFLAVSVYALYLPSAVNMEHVTAFDKPKNADIIKNQINILFLGIDDGYVNGAEGARKMSDAMVVIGINTDDSTMKLLSIPSGTKASIPGHKNHEKINGAYAYGGVSLAQSTVEKLLQAPVHNYVVMDCQAFVEIVDILGGIDLYVENDLKYEDPDANLHIDLKKGYQHLNGKKVGEYVRFCSDEMGDIGRAQRQQRFLKALLKETVKFGTIFKVSALAEAVNKSVNTDISPVTMLKIANTFRSLKLDAIQTEMIPGRFASVNGISYWEPDEEQTKEVVARMFYSVNNPDGAPAVADENKK